MSDKISYTSDFKKFCRTCLLPFDKQQTFSMYDTLVAKHLSKITQVQFVHHSALSTELCLKCYQHLKTAIDFREQVKKIEPQMQQIVILLNEASKIPNVEVVEPDSDNSVEHNVDNNIEEANTQMREDLQCTDDNECVIEFEEDSYNVQNDDVTVKIENDTENNPSSNQEGDKGKAPTRRKALACYYCGKEFKSRSSVLYHEKAIHAREKKHKCTMCDKSFMRKKFLQRHINMHTNTKPFSCKICKKRYYSQHDLDNHKIQHSDVKRYMCDICSKTFKTAGNFYQHRAIHGEKKYQCEHCGYKATSVTLLKQHLVSHMEKKKDIHVKKPKCNVCEKHFSCQYYLDQHMLSHTKEKPYSCDICGEKFRFKGNVKRHKDNCHGRNETSHKTAESL